MKYLLPICAATIAIALAPHNAQASSYSNTSGLSQLEVNDMTKSGSYITKIGGTNWSGKINTPVISNAAGAGNPGGFVYYIGTFVDRPLTAGSTTTCTGDIRMGRKQVNGKYNLEIYWKVTGGNNCPSVGSTPSMTLIESLPIANASGDFNPSNSTTQFQWVNNRDVWPKWKVVDPTGLNCRVTPLGAAAVPTLPVSTVISVTGFHSNATWLKTSSNGIPCYVRANSTYLKPVQLPF